MNNFESKKEDLKNRLLILEDCLDLGEKQKLIEGLRKEIEQPNFWDNKERAIEASQELSETEEEIKVFLKLKNDLDDFSQLVNEIDDEKGLEKEIKDIEKRIEEKETEIFLSGRYDSQNAVLSIFAGAGGRDSQDWATMLLRMYERYAERKDWKVKFLNESFGEAGGPDGRIGIKSVTMEIKGKFSFGILKKENGTHRLVRISPFSTQKLRHTSFAQVEIIPDISDKDMAEIEIKPEEVKMDTFRSSGAGGQNVNKRETAVRLVHIPTGITVTCQSERLQSMNRQKAMKVLIGKLCQLKQLEEEKKLKKIKGEKIDPSWGHQIRSYVLHPYKLVKDLRTEVETSNVEAVLDGDLDKFIIAEIKNKNI
ncbi:MAG: peptide chain release factor 2 [Patescibacteria group bacterium]